MPILAARPIPFTALTSTKQLLNLQCRLRGWAFKETTGSATAEIDVYDGANSGGTLIAQVTLTAGQSTREWFSGGAIDVLNGVAVVVTSGSVSGAVWVVLGLDVVPDEQAS